MKFHDNEQFKYSTMYRHMIVMTCEIMHKLVVDIWNLKVQQFILSNSSAFDKKIIFFVSMFL